MKMATRPGIFIIFSLVFSVVQPDSFDRLNKPPYPIVCNQPLPRKCLKDLKPHCLVGKESPVYGHCALQTAICDDHEKYDSSRSCQPF